MDRPAKERRPQRRMSFNYKWDVQEQSASISFSSFGLTIKRPLDLLDESFERSDHSGPVSLIQLSQGPVIARRENIRPPIDDRSKANFSISEWFCPKLSRALSFRRPAIEGSSDDLLDHYRDANEASLCPNEFSPGYVDSSTVRLTDNARFDPLLLEECGDQQYWQRQRRFPHRRPLPSLPAPSYDDDDADGHDRQEEEEEYFHSRHLSLVVRRYLLVFCLSACIFLLQCDRYPSRLAWLPPNI